MERHVNLTVRLPQNALYVGRQVKYNPSKISSQHWGAVTGLRRKLPIFHAVPGRVHHTFCICPTCHPCRCPRCPRYLSEDGCESYLYLLVLDQCRI